LAKQCPTNVAAALLGKEIMRLTTSTIVTKLFNDAIRDNLKALPSFGVLTLMVILTRSSHTSCKTSTNFNHIQR
jgi:hypothetical protein